MEQSKMLEQLVSEVFVQEERTSAELRLLPSDVETLSEQYGAQCTPMDEKVYSDGKRWYSVQMPM